MKRLFLILYLLLILAIVIQAQDTTALIILTVDEAVDGQLDNGERSTYQFSLVEGEDAIIQVVSDRNILPVYCIVIAESEISEPVCEAMGGGGDGAINLVKLIPAFIQERPVEQVTIELARPIDGIANYSITAFSQQAQALPIGIDRTVAEDELPQPFQIYDITLEEEQAFSATVINTTDEGFLWVAYQPYMIDPSQMRSPISSQVDWATIQTGEIITQHTSLVQVAERIFRLLVQSSVPYNLHSELIVPADLGISTPYVATVSYTNPIDVVTLVDPSDIIMVLAELRGTAGMVGIYNVGNPVGSFLLMGGPWSSGVRYSPRTSTNYPTNNETVLVIQVPPVFSREQIEMVVQWEQGQ